MSQRERFFKIKATFHRLRLHLNLRYTVHCVRALHGAM